MPKTNFSYPKVILTSTIHYDISGEYDAMCYWVDERSGQANPEIKLVSAVLTLFATGDGDSTFLAREHIERICKLIETAGTQTADELNSDARLVAQLRDLSARETRNGGEIAAIRRRQNLGV